MESTQGGLHAVHILSRDQPTPGIVPSADYCAQDKSWVLKDQALKRTAERGQRGNPTNFDVKYVLICKEDIRH
jgi:hypothetical protein